MHEYIMEQLQHLLQSHIYLFKGYDANNQPFSAFISCDEDTAEFIESSGRFNMNETSCKIIHVLRGHDVSQQIKNNVIEYILSRRARV